MISLKIKVDKLVDKFKNAIDLSKNLKPLMVEIVGPVGSNDPKTLRGGVAKAFQSKGSSIGQAWNPLNPDYLISKTKKYGQKPSLIATGKMFNSLVYAGEGGVEKYSGSKLWFGTTIPYAAFHQVGGGRLPQRSFLRIMPKQMKFWRSLIFEYYKASLTGEQYRGQK